MCGIAGILDHGGGDLERSISGMVDSLHHRGPDDFGTWIDKKVGLALGHKRLSILDLSPEGHQPMESASGRYVLTFNGEIYNFAELRRELGLKGHVFRGHSDTEVMLAAFEEWGIEKSVTRFIGMFAFGVWDRTEHTLTLVRDRLGKKPLYFGWMGRTFLFGSELKALRCHPDFRGEIDRDALALYLRHNYIPAPYCMYRNVYKLLPGCLLTVPLHHAHHATDFSPFPESTRTGWKPLRYWSALAIAEQGCAHVFTGSEKEAADELDRLLREAVRVRMVADVPLGAFLSGGVDSSTVVALMQAQSTRPVKTFTIGFHEPGYNEAKDAQKVARHLGTEHTELYVTPEEAMAVIPNLPSIYDEPFSDSSQIPTFLVSQLARRHVIVSLSGDGGDELFTGYTRYFLADSIWKKIRWMPESFRQGIAGALTVPSPERWNTAVAHFRRILPARFNQHNIGDKIHKLAEILSVGEPNTIYLQLVSLWKEPTSLVLKSSEPQTVISDPLGGQGLPDFTRRVMYFDTVTYLPDDLLVKVDRASMAVGLEARVPLLDHRVVEFAWRLPLHLKVRHGQGKWLLRQVLHRYVPAELVERPKMGFGVPIGSWLRGPLRQWAEELLSVKTLEDGDLLNPEPIRQKWEEHVSGRRNWQYHLWDILMFQAWRQHWQH